MTYTHLTINELVLIETYFESAKPVSYIAEKLSRSRQTIYNVYHALAEGQTALNIYETYKENKRRCGRRTTVLPDNQAEYVQKMVDKGWTPDVIVGRNEHTLNCSSRTLYRLFKAGKFDVSTLPMKGKRKPNHHHERRGRQAFKRSIHERNLEYTEFSTEFGHLEGDTIVGAKHKSAIITLVERLSKVIVTLKPQGRQAKDIETSLNQWLKSVPKNLFKSITFDCGKEFSNWKSVSNQHDIDIYFADPGTPSQRGLNEHSNGLLRKDGLLKQMDFNNVDQDFIQSVASKRNNIPRKSLNYQTPLEVFLSYVNEDNLSSLI